MNKQSLSMRIHSINCVYKQTWMGKAWESTANGYDATRHWHCISLKQTKVEANHLVSVTKQIKTKTKSLEMT